MPEPELAQFGVSSLAIDSTNVYWTNYANRRALPTCGQSAVTLASGQGQPTNIAVDSARIHWTNAGASR